MVQTACHDAVMSASPTPNTTGRLARGPFVLAVAAVYVLGFLSQTFSSPLAPGVGVVPFVLAQFAFIAIWLVLHRWRLRDAGRSTGIAIGAAGLYVLSALPVAWMMIASSGSTVVVGPGAPILNLVAVLYFLSLGGASSPGTMQFWFAVLIVLTLLPGLILLGFSVWAATRPSAPGTP